MRKSNLFKMIMAAALSMALIFSTIPVSGFADDTGGTLSVDVFGGRTQVNIYNAENPTAQNHDSTPDDGGYGGSHSALQSAISQGVFSSFSTTPPLENIKPRFAENRVIVKLAGSDGNMMAAAVGNPRDRSFPPIPGVSFTDIRILNPSMENSNTGGFSTDTFQTPTQIFTFNSQLSTFNSDKSVQNNVFVLTLEETGMDAVQNALAILNASPDVEIAEPDFLYEISATPNDPMFNAQYALERINAEQAWDITTGSMSVVVGVVDTGIDGTHPDLINNLWVNPNPNQNGYLDDIHGYNFTGRIGGVPTDMSGHGTHVAGIIGAKGNNGIGISGVNWDVSLAWLGIDAGNDTVSASAAIEAINYAHNHNIPILNNSWGGSSYSETLKEAIANYNGLFVASAGNDGSDNDIFPKYPASYDLPNVISVASTDALDKLSDFSNYGANSVHIAAPGSGILSTFSYGSFAAMSGTSMASPHVAGVAALIKSVFPDYTPEAVRELLIRSARSVDALSELGDFGIVDAYAAMLLGIDVGDLYSVTFDFLDDETEPVVVKVFPGARIREPAEPEKAGYVFDGWYTEAYGGVPYNFSDAVNGDMTLYARWFIPEPGMYYWEFPDLNFQREVLRLLNEQAGGQWARSSIVAYDEALLASFTSLDVSNKNISDITGLGYFTGLTDLDCSQNRLTELDISKNTALTWLDCSDNELTELDVKNNTGLKHLNGSYNQMAFPDSVTGWREIGLVLDSNFIFYPQKTAFTELQREIAAYGDATEDIIITIRTDIHIMSSLTIPGNPNGKTLTITSDNGTRTLIRRSTVNMFVINEGASVILENIIFDGNMDAYPYNWGSLVHVYGGELIMNDGAILRNNHTSHGGGVNVTINGEFTMNGGYITGNTATDTGGGVSMSGRFTMNGGEISGNTAMQRGGGVSVWDNTFTMTDGIITNNTSFDDGGGVDVGLSSEFAMTGGEISRNTAMRAGGVLVPSGFCAGDDNVFTACKSTFNVGGTAVVSGNTPYNVYLFEDVYITPGDGASSGGNGVMPPAPGMEIWVTKTRDGGVIVESGARPGDEAYFFADESRKKIVYDAGRLRIVDRICIGDICVPDGSTDITIPQNLVLANPVVITAGDTLTIRGANPDVTLTRGVSGNLFYINNGAKLILEDIIIDGGGRGDLTSSFGSLVYVYGNGTLIMNDGAVLRNNSAAAYGGGVYVGNGTFTMNGGEITGNEVYAYQSDSGGIVITFLGGAGGGVFVGNGTFTMNAGTIRGNSAYAGGGVYVLSGTFTMNGGEIIENEACLNPSNSGGTIISPDGSGGGVRVGGGTFTMTGGEITGNTADYSGGGAFISSGRFILGGTSVISGNINDNVYLSRVSSCYIGGDCFEGTSYIALSTDTPPETGMYVGVRTEAADGVIVESGANPGDEAYFFADEYGKEVTYKDGQLRIFYDVTTFIYGDVNGDGEVNVADSMMLARWMAGWSGIAINEAAADVNADGEVLLDDLVILRRHIVGWIGYETLPLMPQRQASPAMALMNAALFNNRSAVPAINVSSASGNVGDIVDVSISLSDNPGMVVMRLGVGFDDSVLRLVEVIDNGMLGERYHGNAYASPYTLLWANGVSPVNFDYSGEIVTLRFEILSETAGSPVRISYAGAKKDVLDVDLNPVYFEVNDGLVSTGDNPFREIIPPDFKIIDYTVVSTVRSGSTFDYEVHATVKNVGGAAENVKAALVELPPSIIAVPDGEISFGNIPSGETKTSEDTFTIRIDRTIAFDGSMLVFDFDFDE